MLNLESTEFSHHTVLGAHWGRSSDTADSDPVGRAATLSPCAADNPHDIADVFEIIKKITILVVCTGVFVFDLEGRL